MNQPTDWNALSFHLQEAASPVYTTLWHLAYTRSHIRLHALSDIINVKQSPCKISSTAEHSCGRSHYFPPQYVRGHSNGILRCAILRTQHFTTACPHESGEIVATRTETLNETVSIGGMATFSEGVRSESTSGTVHKTAVKMMYYQHPVKKHHFICDSSPTGPHRVGGDFWLARLLQ